MAIRQGCLSHIFKTAQLASIILLAAAIYGKCSYWWIILPYFLGWMLFIALTIFQKWWINN